MVGLDFELQQQQQHTSAKQISFIIDGIRNQDKRERSNNKPMMEGVANILATNGCLACGTPFETEPSDRHYPFISGVCHHTVCKRCLDQRMEEEREGRPNWKGGCIRCPVCAADRAFNINKLIKNMALADVLAGTRRLVVGNEMEEDEEGGY